MAEMNIIDSPNFDKKSFQNLLSSIPSYHQKEDTFFVSPKEPTPAVSYDIDGEIWIRFDPQTKEIVGLEIEDFETIFLKKHPELYQLWKEVKPYCVRKKQTRANSEGVCDSFILILVEFFSSLLKDNPPQSSFGLTQTA